MKQKGYNTDDLLRETSEESPENNSEAEFNEYNLERETMLIQQPPLQAIDLNSDLTIQMQQQMLRL